MKKLKMLLICMALMAVFVALSFCASAACSSCSKEADWSETASAFISGTPMSDEPIAFGPKVARAESSQFERDAPQAVESAAVDSAKIILQRINATPATVNSSAASRINAVFAQNETEDQSQDDLQLSVIAIIKDSEGKEVKKLNLIKVAANEYSNDWTIDVPPGTYSVDIAASSIDASANFAKALQIVVIGPEEKNETSAT